MEGTRPSKRPKSSVDNSLEEKVQTLPLLCVESIVKFTPTSKLIRLHSKAVPLPGAFWSFCVQAAIEKRLPLSLGDDLAYYRAEDPTFQIYDVTGARVASIKQPAAFPASSISELVEKATLAIRPLLPRSLGQKSQLTLVSCEGLLLGLPNLKDLTLVVRKMQRNANEVVKAPNMKHLLPKLESLAIRNATGVHNTPDLDTALVSFLREMPFDAMSSLRRLDLSEHIFGSVVQTWAASNDLAARRVLLQLNCLEIWRGMPWHQSYALVRFISVCFKQITKLSVLVVGAFRVYLAAFRAMMPGLTSLGLYLLEANLQGLKFVEGETVRSVSDLRICPEDDEPRRRMFAVASLFPNARSFAYRSNDLPGPFELLSEFCTRRVLPNLTQLGCFFRGEFGGAFSKRLTEFLANPDLPEFVDLSSMAFAKMAEEPGLLTAIYNAMQVNAIKRLLLRGPLHSDALGLLQSHIELNHDDAKVVAARTDPELGLPGVGDLESGAIVAAALDFCRYTDITIVGTKSAGSWQVEGFTIRVVHHQARRSCIFE